MSTTSFPHPSFIICPGHYPYLDPPTCYGCPLRTHDRKNLSATARPLPQHLISSLVSLAHFYFVIALIPRTMKRTPSNIDDNRYSNHIIDTLIDKITSGQFQVEAYDITRADDRKEAQVKMKITGVTNGAFWPDTPGNTSTGTSDSQEETPSLRPDEKEVQEQIANCYL